MSASTATHMPEAASSTIGEQVRAAAIAKVGTINAVEGFDPAPLAIDISDMNTGSVRYRLPVMAQMAWFRLKYPEGRISVSVKPGGKDSTGNAYFIADARIYAHYSHATECYLSEGSASRGQLPDKPTVSPREWAQTAAIGMALRNAGFGLQFAVAGESYEDNTLNELAGISFAEAPGSFSGTTPPGSSQAHIVSPEQTQEQPEPQESPPGYVPPQPEPSPLDRASAMLCPIVKYKDKTLGEMVRIDPKALMYVSDNGSKYGDEVAQCAKLICETALQQTA